MQVTEGMIQEWKSTYGYVGKATIANKDYYFRTLTRDEYAKTISEQMEQELYDYEKEVCKICILGDENWVNSELENKAGIATVLAEHILQKSGFQQIEVEDI